MIFLQHVLVLGCGHFLPPQLTGRLFSLLTQSLGGLEEAVVFFSLSMASFISFWCFFSPGMEDSLVLPEAYNG